MNRQDLMKTVSSFLRKIPLWRRNVALFTFLALYGLSSYAQDAGIQTLKGRQIDPAAFENYVLSKMDSLAIPGLSIAVISRKSIVYSKNLGIKSLPSLELITPQSLFEACSLSKPVFAYFTLLLVERQVLSLDEPLYHYFIDSEVDYAADEAKLLTARMVLNHCSGFANWREPNAGKLKFNFIPGTQYGYSGEGYQLLKRTITSILGVNDAKLNDYFQDEVAEPLGITTMNFVGQDSLLRYKAYGHKSGQITGNKYKGGHNFDTAGGLVTTAKDYGIFLLKLMDPQDKTALKLLELQKSLPPEPNGLYRSLGFPYRVVDGKMQYFHSGNNGDTRAYCFFYPEDGFGVVMLSNCDHFFSSGFASDILEFLDEKRLE